MIKKRYSIFPLSLTAKMAIVVAEVLLLTVGISAYIGIKIQEERLIKRTQQESFQVSQTIYNQLERTMISGRKDEVQSFLKDIGTSDRIVEATVFDPRGFIKFSSQADKLGQTVDTDYKNVFQSKESKLYISMRARRETMAVITPIHNKLACQKCHGTEREYLGALYFQPSLGWILEESVQNRNLMFLSAILTILIAGSVITLLSHKLIREPISNLEKTMEEVAQGGIFKRVNVQSEDEVGRLGQHFNTMIDQLEKAKKDLEKAHEAELLRAGKLASLGELAAGLVHEMKNPLSGISAATQVLAEQLPANDPRREIMQEMINQVERLNKTLNDLLSFARPRSPHLQPYDVNEVVQNVMVLFQSQAHQQNITIVENYAQNLPKVNIDPEQIKQVLLNLVLNSVQAMGKNGTLTVETKITDAQTVSIRVQDTGKGISPENIEKIFVPFFTTRAKGTGLGLPVSKNLVEMHGGRLTVESELGINTTFSIHLPLDHKKV